MTLRTTLATPRICRLWAGCAPCRSWISAFWSGASQGSTTPSRVGCLRKDSVVIPAPRRG